MSPLPPPPFFRSSAYTPLFSPASKHLSVSTSLGKTTRLTPPRTASPRDGERNEGGELHIARSLHSPVVSRPLPTEEAVSIAGETENNWNNIFPHCTSPVLLHLLRYVAALFSAGLNWDAWKSETTRGYERRGNNGRRREGGRTRRGANAE